MSGALAELDRGALVEWFVNRPDGLEQGWTIARRPAGEGPLEIGLELSGDLWPRLRADGQGGSFVDADGVARLRYEHLVAWDATGRELPTRLAPTPAGLVVRVDDAGAAYPVVVDPLILDHVWSAEVDQDGARFGTSVACAGDVNGDGYSDVIVGAPLFDSGAGTYVNSGLIRVFHGSSAGLETSVAWSSSLAQSGASLGWSVASAGDVNGDGFSDVIASARDHDGLAGADEGRVFVYHGSPTGLLSAPSWSFVSGQAGALLGSSVSCAGDVNGDGYSDVVVGASRYDGSFVDEGRAWVFLGSASGLGATPAWTADGGQLDAHFGESVATAGDVDGDGYHDVLVGALGYDDTQIDEGAVFLFPGSVAGPAASSWSFSPGQSGANLGRSVATAGDVNGDGYADVIVGAETFDDDTVNEGRVFVFHGSSSGLGAAPDWTKDGNQLDCLFGWAVGCAGDLNGDGYSDVVVGAQNYDAGEVNEGVVFVYPGSAGGLDVVDWSRGADQAGARLGRSVGTAGDVDGDGYADLLAGAHLFDGGHVDGGRAVLYRGAVEGPATSPDWTAQETQPDARFGYSVAFAGDVDGDGFSDVLIGAREYGAGSSNAGGAFLYRGTASGLETAATWSVLGAQPEGRLGHSVAAAGDVNGDGYDDVVIGEPYYTAMANFEGRISLYLGSSSGLSSSAAWSTTSGWPDAFLGWVVSSAGDVNGDGYSDVLVAAPGFHGPGSFNEGFVSLYLGGPLGPSTEPDWQFFSNQTSAELASAMDSAGDVNGDGYDDVILAARSYETTFKNEGRVWAFYGSPEGLSATPDWFTNGTQAQAFFGSSAAGVGDMNGDGFSDVVVGAEGWDNAFDDEGRAFLYLGSATGLGAAVVAFAGSRLEGERFGYAVAGAGDVDGDGYSDVLVGAPRNTSSTTGGTVYLYRGSATSLWPSPAWSVSSSAASELFGHAIAGGGDVHGDGYADVLVAAPLAGGGQVFLYGGNDGGGGPLRALTQRRLDAGTPLSTGALLPPNAAFRLSAELPSTLAATSWSSAVPTKVALEWEVRRRGEAFDPAGALRSAWVSVPALGLPLLWQERVAMPVTGIPALDLDEAVFRWRVRLVTSDPLYPASPWFSLPGSAVTETKLRRARSENAQEAEPPTQR